MKSISLTTKLFFVFLFGFISVFLLTRSHWVSFQGETMGTTFTIKFQYPYWRSSTGLYEEVQDTFRLLDTALSTYNPDSEISRFNAIQGKTPVLVSDDFYDVMQVSLLVYRLSNGAWDGTVWPLYELWGFGTSSPISAPPAKEDIERTLAHVGFSKVNFFVGHQLVKYDPLVQLDLSSVAKGYGVDKVVTLLKSKGITHYYVEIGGEISVSKSKTKGFPWRIGISWPNAAVARTDFVKRVSLSNQAMATSGDYEHFWEYEGKRFSHIIDPKTGWPIENEVASVSVIAPTCAFADGLATSIMVMGVEKGLSLLESLPNVEGLIIERDKDGELVMHTTTHFPTN